MNTDLVFWLRDKISELENNMENTRNQVSKYELALLNEIEELDLDDDDVRVIGAIIAGYEAKMCPNCTSKNYHVKVNGYDADCYCLECAHKWTIEYMP